jgi:hypothetical protein
MAPIPTTPIDTPINARDNARGFVATPAVAGAGGATIG